MIIKKNGALRITGQKSQKKGGSGIRGEMLGSVAHSGRESNTEPYKDGLNDS